MQMPPIDGEGSLRIFASHHGEDTFLTVLGLGLWRDFDIEWSPLSALLIRLSNDRRGLIHVGTNCAEFTLASTALLATCVGPDYGKFVAYDARSFDSSSSLVVTATSDAILRCVEECSFEEAGALYTSSVSSEREMIASILTTLATVAGSGGGSAESVDVTLPWMQGLSKRNVSSHLIIDGGNGLRCIGSYIGYSEDLISAVSWVAKAIEATAWYAARRDSLVWDNESDMLVVQRS